MRILSVEINWPEAGKKTSKNSVERRHRVIFVVVNFRSAFIIALIDLINLLAMIGGCKWFLGKLNFNWPNNFGTECHKQLFFLFAWRFCSAVWALWERKKCSEERKKEKKVWSSQTGANHDSSIRCALRCSVSQRTQSTLIGLNSLSIKSPLSIYIQRT